LGTMQSIGAWIFTPKYVEFSVSEDGKKYRLVDKLNSDVPDNREGEVIKQFELDHQRLKARYVKVFAKNYGLLPKWHLGAGGKAWIFVDEICIDGPFK